MKDDLTQQKESFNDRAENYYMSRNGDKQLLLRNLLYKELLKDINICKKKLWYWNLCVDMEKEKGFWRIFLAVLFLMKVLIIVMKS